MPPMISNATSILALLAAALVGVNGSVAKVSGQYQAATASSADVTLADRPDRSVAPALPAEPAVTIPKASDGLFYVTGTVNGAPVRFLVDTGANLVVLTADDARRVGVISNASAPDGIETAGGTSSMARVSLDDVTVAGRHVARLDAAVMRDGLSVSLLGQNMLSKVGPIMIVGDVMTLGARR